MIYKNGWKEYLTAALVYGGIMGLLLGLITLSLSRGLLIGVFSGGVFTLLIFLFCKYQENKFKGKRIEIAQERKIICDGGATLQGNGGWLFFTEAGIEFYPHKINFSRSEMILPLPAIKNVSTKKNQLVIETSENQTVTILVSHTKEWKQQIEEYLKNAVSV